MSRISSYLLILLCGVLLSTQGGFPGVDATDESPRYAVIMDAGSTGTRVHVYSWQTSQSLDTLVEVANKRVRIPLSSLISNQAGVQSLLGTLISFADEHIPEKDRSKTSISLKATAGLRRLPHSDQQYLINAVHNFLEDSVYSFLPEDTAVIPGTEEALYDFMAVMVAMDDSNIGVLDMGGASKQLSYVVDLDLDAPAEFEVGVDGDSAYAFTPVNTDTLSMKCEPDYVLQIPGTNRSAGLVTRSIQGMGLLAAMDFILDLFVSKADDGSPAVTAPHPCLAVGTTTRGEIHDYDTPMEGYGNFEECYELIHHHFMDRVAGEIDLRCLQKHKPKKFVGLDNFPKLMEMMGLVNSDEGNHDQKLESMSKITPQSVMVAGQEICQISWEELLSKFPDTYPAYRAQRACFGAAYIYFFMKDVYGIPELSQGEFFPLDSHEEHNLSWVLGAIAVTAHENPEEFFSKYSKPGLKLE